MPTPEALRVQRLAPGQCLKLRNAAGCTVRCCAGTIWITQQDDPRDRVLAAGQSFTFDRPGVVLISAAEGMRDEWLEDTGITLLCLPVALAVSG